MIEILAKAVEVAKDVVSSKLNDLTPDFLKEKTIGPEKPADIEKIRNDVKNAAQAAQKFFELEKVPIQEGKSVAVQLRNRLDKKDDVFIYNLEQFKKMGCNSFAEMTKVWSHECGHRILQDKKLSSWSAELGADFLMGARSAMLGLPNGAMEKFLGSQPMSATHPAGKLRKQAIELGRATVAEMKMKGIKPTWQNCFAEFQKSTLSKMPETRGMLMTNPFMQNPFGQVGFIDNKTYHLGKANDWKSKGDYYTKKCNDAIKKGDLKSAQDYSRSADRWYKDSNDALSSAKRCSK